MDFDHVVLLASDLEASLAWYEAVLGAIGFRKSREHVWVNGKGHALELRQAGEPEPGYRRSAPGMNHIAFRALDLATLEAAAEMVRAAGFEVPQTQQFGADTALFLKDRDGMRIEITVYGESSP